MKQYRISALHQGQGQGRASKADRGNALHRLAQPIRNLAGRMGQAVQGDSLRLPLQTVVSVLIAYLAMSFLDLPDASWATFSALFVVRASVEGTVGEAFARISGALVGVALGVLLVGLTTAGQWSPIWGIGIGVGVMGFVSARWPVLNYGLVTVVVLTVTPDPDILGSAWDKAVAIVMGSISGIAAAAAVLPLSAGRRAHFDLADSIDSYAKVLGECTATLTDCDAHPRQATMSTVEPACERARALVEQARSAHLNLLSPHRIPTRLLDHVDRLWRTLPLVDRATGTPFNANSCRHLGPFFERLETEVGNHLGKVSQSVRGGDYASLQPMSQAPMDVLGKAIRQTCRERTLDTQEQETVEIVRWAWHVVMQEINQLTECVANGKTRKS